MSSGPSALGRPLPHAARRRFSPAARRRPNSGSSGPTACAEGRHARKWPLRVRGRRTSVR